MASHLAGGAAPAQTPFPCTGEALMVVGGVDSQLVRIDQSVSPFTFVPIGAPTGIEINSLGFRQTDGLLYGVELIRPSSNNGIIRFDADAKVTSVGVPAGLPTNRFFLAGDVSTDGTTIYLNEEGVGSLYSVNIALLTASSVAISGGEGNVSDWAYNSTDGLLYGGDSTDGELAVLDPATGARTDFSVVGGLPTGSAFGGAWFDSSGHLFLYRNAGAIYEIDTAGPTIVSTQLGSSAAQSDATYCPAADLSVTKTDSPDPVDAAETLTYTVDVSNAGPSTATSLSVVDTLPAAVSFVSASGTGWTCGEAVGVVTCTRASLAVGAAPAINITVTAPVEGQSLTNDVAVSAAENDPSAADNSVSETTTVTAVADLSITKSDLADPVVAGATLTYVIDVDHAGPSTANTISVVDTLPAGTSFLGAAGTGWACAEAGGVVTCTRDSLAVGPAPTLTITTTAPSQGGVVTNTVAVSAGEPDRDLTDNTAAEDTTVGSAADLSITKDDGATSAVPGQPLTYTIVASNAGPSDVDAATVADSFPAELTCSWTSAANGGAADNTAGSGPLGDTL
ncbi:MAG: DUF11 domain-containing protein, partial [Thermoanaerobaculia bacterium]